LEKTQKYALCAAIAVMAMLAVAFVGISDDDASDGDEKLLTLGINDTLEIVTGSGTVNHTAGQDICAYNENVQTTLTMTVTSHPAGGYNQGWDDVGTIRITDVSFKDNSDLIYVPSYIVDKVKNDIALYKVDAIDDSVVEKINGRTISIVLPQALRGVDFDDSVTELTEGSYVDTKGNTVHYAVVETGTMYMNGFGGYTMYTNSTEPDIRYCEQGRVISVDYAPGQDTYDKTMVQWSKNPLTSPDTWICGTWADMIGTVLIESGPSTLTFVGTGDVTLSDDFINYSGFATVTILDDVIVVEDEVVVAYTPKSIRYSYGPIEWSVQDGDILEGDMIITASAEKIDNYTSDDPLAKVRIVFGIVRAIIDLFF